MLLEKKNEAAKFFYTELQDVWPKMNNIYTLVKEEDNLWLANHLLPTWPAIN